MDAPSAVLAGLQSRCPNCGRGPLFESYLKLAPRCASCGASFAIADAGDGPAVFVIFIVGALVVPLAFILDFGFKLPGWATIGVTFAAAIGLSLLLLPVFKSVLFALQWKHKSGEGRLYEEGAGEDAP